LLVRVYRASYAHLAPKRQASLLSPAGFTPQGRSPHGLTPPDPRPRSLFLSISSLPFSVLLPPPDSTGRRPPTTTAPDAADHRCRPLRPPPRRHAAKRRLDGILWCDFPQVLEDRISRRCLRTGISRRCLRRRRDLSQVVEERQRRVLLAAVGGGTTPAGAGG
jgi:hypothetical protein